MELVTIGVSIVWAVCVVTVCILVSRTVESIDTRRAQRDSEGLANLKARVAKLEQRTVAERMQTGRRR